jgi:hypothetical protein
MNSGFDAEVLELELAEIHEIDMSAFSFDIDAVIPPDGFGDKFALPDADKPDICTMTFTVHMEQKS